ncbi:hypothetical protein AS9A_0866 [Hoyosella subflava DQS3-9A1]|uniref:Uncharacterized protein n=1 Tax=Hoyosella subflava (strain DSM 45089 / JCM 17490 / NBRC 109087 / DQS3-9A1) TaxID=443218 RepID=F6EMB2_HOYSD|nr:hypothetical protein AS9A_0866 [Hoyosella subflava DQS3-9A1]
MEGAATRTLVLVTQTVYLGEAGARVRAYAELCSIPLGAGNVLLNSSLLKMIMYWQCLA